jgi:hypothetical protein
MLAGCGGDIGIEMNSFLEWTEHHAGLAGWVGALGAIIAIFVAWAIARAEYRRDERRAQARKNREIDLLKRLVAEFNVLMDIYFGACQGHMNDPRWHSMADLAHVPVTQWPSIEAYVSFKTYWFKSIQDMQSKFIDPDLASRIANHQLRLSNLMKALDGARR